MVIVSLCNIAFALQLIFKIVHLKTHFKMQHFEIKRFVSKPLEFFFFKKNKSLKKKGEWKQHVGNQNFCVQVFLFSLCVR